MSPKFDEEAHQIQISKLQIIRCSVDGRSISTDLFYDITQELTLDSMMGLRSSHNDCRGLMNINDFDESIPFAAFILSIPLAPG